MPIKVACQCGQSFAAPDHLAGKNVKCPKCGAALTIPSAGAAASGAAASGAAATRPPAQRPPAPRPPAPRPPAPGGMADLLDEVGVKSHAGHRCGACNAPMSAATTICVQCGFNMATGAKVASNVRTGPKPDAHGHVAESLLSRAAKEIDKAPKQQGEESNASVAASYLLAFGLISVALVVGYGAFIGFQALETSDNSQYYAGLVMVVLGCIMSNVSIWTLIYLNAKDGWVHGLCSAFIPFYAPVYGMLRGYGFWAYLFFFANFLILVGFVTMWYFETPPDGATTWMWETLRLAG